jgi:hypothetical protein
VPEHDSHEASFVFLFVAEYLRLTGDRATVARSSVARTSRRAAAYLDTLPR